MVFFWYLVDFYWLLGFVDTLVVVGYCTYNYTYFLISVDVDDDRWMQKRIMMVWFSMTLGCFHLGSGRVLSPRSHLKDSNSSDNGSYLWHLKSGLSCSCSIMIFCLFPLDVRIIDAYWDTWCVITVIIVRMHYGIM